MTATASSAADAHGEHKHHVCSFSQFFGIYVALLFLTVLTVLISSRVTGIDMGPFSLIIAMGVASLKAGLVMTVFMHLRWDTAINNIAFLSSLLFLSLLFLFTIADFKTRGYTDPVLTERPALDIPDVYKTRRTNAGSSDPNYEHLLPYLDPNRVGG